MKLTIKGGESKIKQLARELTVRAKRNNLELSIDEDKKGAVKSPNTTDSKEDKPKAKTKKTTSKKK